MSDLHRAWIGRKVRQLRRNKGMTQADLAVAVVDAGAVACHQSTVSNWERGRTEPSIHHRVPLAIALNVPADLLYAGPPEGWQAAA